MDLHHQAWAMPGVGPKVPGACGELPGGTTPLRPPLPSYGRKEGRGGP